MIMTWFIYWFILITEVNETKWNWKIMQLKITENLMSASVKGKKNNWNCNNRHRLQQWTFKHSVSIHQNKHLRRNL